MKKRNSAQLNSVSSEIPLGHIFNHILFIFFIIGTEYLFLFFFRDGLTRFSDQYTIRTYLNENSGHQFWLATHIRPLFITSFYFLLICLGLMTARDFKCSNYFAYFKITIKSLLINLVSFCLIIGVLIAINDPRPLVEYPLSFKAIIYTISPVFWIFYLYSVLNLLCPIKLLIDWLLRNLFFSVFVFFTTAITVNQWLTDSLVNFWSSLLLIPSIDLALLFARLFGMDVKLFGIGANGPIIGTNNFQVEMWPACSGYEGLSLILTILALYCYMQRNYLFVWRAILIFPVASATMFFLNSLRIAILIWIGSYYSPLVALNGFHLVGGWFNLLIVVILSFFVLNNFPFFRRESQFSIIKRWDDAPFLMPLVGLISAGMLIKIFQGDFPWLYPLPIFISAIIIFHFRNSLRPTIEMPSSFAYMVGIVVFLLWLYLVPVDEKQNLEFFKGIQSAPIGISMGWLLSRIVGASLIVPISEELAFRGFMLPKLTDWIAFYFSKIFSLKFSPSITKQISAAISLLVTSLLFGILHSDILAGSLAGLAFGLAYLFKRKLIDAIVAHSITNALLAINVIYFGNWSYW